GGEGVSGVGRVDGEVGLDLAVQRVDPRLIGDLIGSVPGERAEAGNLHQRAKDRRRVPQLAAVRAVVGAEVELVVHGDQEGRVGVRATGAAAAGVDVLDEDGAGGGAVALVQLGAVHAVVGDEEQRAVDRHEGRGGRAGAARYDVRDQRRRQAGGRQAAVF